MLLALLLHPSAHLRRPVANGAMEASKAAISPERARYVYSMTQRKTAGHAAAPRAARVGAFKSLSPKRSGSPSGSPGRSSPDQGGEYARRGKVVDSPKKKRKSYLR